MEFNIRLFRGPLAVTSIGASALGGLLSATAKQPKAETSWLQNPEYAHSQDARDQWFGKLQEWGKDPNYGAISPDWNNIWDTVQNHIKQYYGGGPLSPGVQAGVSSSLARRNMSDSPASDYLHAQISAKEGGDLADAATQQGIQKTNLSEAGRRTWLDSINAFQAQKPAGQWNTTITDPGAMQRGIGQAISGVGSAVGSFGMQQMGQQNSMALLDKYMSGNQPTTFAPQSSSSGTPDFSPLRNDLWKY